MYTRFRPSGPDVLIVALWLYTTDTKLVPGGRSELENWMPLETCICLGMFLLEIAINSMISLIHSPQIKIFRKVV